MCPLSGIIPQEAASSTFILLFFQVLTDTLSALYRINGTPKQPP